MSLVSELESIIFAAGKPVSINKIKKELKKNKKEIESSLELLIDKYNTEESGIWIVKAEDSVQMVTNPKNKDAAEKFTKNELTGELTKAQLEALTVIAYQGPLTRPELEEIRSVNCALILRNLLIRGLIQEKEEKSSVMPVYSVSCDALKHLGITSVDELPDYQILHKHEYIMKLHESAARQQE